MRSILNVKIQKIKENAKIPMRATEGSAGYDLYACIDKPTTVEPGETILFPLGFKTSFDSDHVALIFARSGTAIKHGCAPANKVGVIDSDYRGEWIVALNNHSKVPFTIEPGDRIAQVLFIEKDTVAFIDTDDLDDTERGEGGFNSTGVK